MRKREKERDSQREKEKKREIHNEEKRKRGFLTKRKRQECSIEDYKEEFMIIFNNPCANLLSVKSVKSVRAMKSVRGTKTELDKNQFIHL